MEKLLLVLFFLPWLASIAFSQGAPPITWTEADGSPRKTAPTKIIVSNGTLSCSGSTCTITTGGGSAGGSNTQLQYNNAGVFGGISGATSNGTNVTFGSANLIATFPIIGSGIFDPNSNEQVTFSVAGSAVNNFNFSNAATGVAPAISTVGGDSDIVFLLSPKGNARLESTGPLRLSGTITDTFTTPAASSIQTKINIPIFDPGAFGQVVAMGVPTGATASARVMSFLDGRAGNHQPTLAVFSPDESQVAGISWNGSNSEVTFANSGTITRFNNGSAASIVAITPPGTSPQGYLSVVSGNAAAPAGQFDSAATPSADIIRATINGDTTAGAYAGVSSGGYLFDVGIKRVSAQFDKTNTTLANVTGLSVNVVAGKSYKFEAVLFVDADVTGGSKYAIGGTATATAIIYQVNLLDNGANAYTITSRQTALAGSAGQAGTTAGLAKIEGVITVNASGTLTVQFAQNAASGTSSVLIGSTFKVNEIP